MTAIALLCLLFAWPPREGVAAAYAAMSEIAGIHARQILDSRGYPTVELEVTLGSGVIRRAAVPAGESTGRLEAIERRDGGKRWSAMGVSAAVSAVKGEIAAVLRGRDPQDQADVDRALLRWTVRGRSRAWERTQSWRPRLRLRKQQRPRQAHRYGATSVERVQDAVSPRASGPCVRCGRPVEGPPGLSYDDRLVWALGHPDGDRAVLAAQTRL